MWKGKKNCFIWSECNANAWLGQLLDNKFSFLSILLLKALFPTLTFGKTNLLENFITSLDSLFSPLPSIDTLKVSGDFLLSFHPEWETTSFAWSIKCGIKYLAFEMRTWNFSFIHCGFHEPLLPPNHRQAVLHWHFFFFCFLLANVYKSNSHLQWNNIKVYP